MHCPSCGQQHVSNTDYLRPLPMWLGDEKKFCSRCGFPMELVAELLDHGGFLPKLAETDQKKTIFTRKNGVVFSIFWMILLMMLIPAIIAIGNGPGEGVEIFLVHPGGPLYATKDDGVWTIPKGEFDDGEDSLTAGRREFEEETSFKIAGDFFELKTVKQKGGKVVHAWAVEADVDADAIQSNTFKMEWPPKSGKMSEFPEVDRAAWFNVDTAKQKINPAQTALINELTSRV